MAGVIGVMVMKKIDADKLLDILKEERDKAIAWHESCEWFNDRSGLFASTEAVLTYNKVICLINGMDVIE